MGLKSFFCSFCGKENHVDIRQGGYGHNHNVYVSRSGRKYNFEDKYYYDEHYKYVKLHSMDIGESGWVVPWCLDEIKADPNGLDNMLVVQDKCKNRGPFGTMTAKITRVGQNNWQVEYNKDEHFVKTVRKVDTWIF